MLTSIMDLDEMARNNSFDIYREKSTPEEIEFLLRLQWWNLPREMIQKMVDRESFRSIEKIKSFAADNGLV